MIHRIIPITLFLLLLSCSSEPNQVPANQDDETLNATSTEPIYEIIVSELPGKGYGYQILKDGKLIIDQQQIPAVQGNQYFSSEDRALKTGELALKKIKEQMFPPTISVEELDSLGVI